MPVSPGKNISGIEIRVYKESSLGNYSGGESNPSLSYMVGNESNWKSFSKKHFVIQNRWNKKYRQAVTRIII